MSAPATGFMNSVKSKIPPGITNFVTTWKKEIQLFFYLIVAVGIIYTIYTVLFPPPDKLEQLLLTDTRAANELGGQQWQIFPPVTSGGEYSISTWMNISSWDYRSGQVKHVFTLMADGKPAGQPDYATMVGFLYPDQNKLAIRVHMDTASMGAASAGMDRDFTVIQNISDLYKGTAKLSSGGEGMDFPICDVSDLDLQKWICITIVVAGRVVDVYVDGKLARSCVCPGIPLAKDGNHFMTMADQGGWGGGISTTRFYGYALTPARIYDIYQEGPAEKRGLDKRYGFIGWLAERLGLTIDYAGLNKATESVKA
jgi:hypothetical protein